MKALCLAIMTAFSVIAQDRPLSTPFTMEQYAFVLETIHEDLGTSDLERIPVVSVHWLSQLPEFYDVTIAETPVDDVEKNFTVRQNTRWIRYGLTRLSNSDTSELVSFRAELQQASRIAMAMARYGIERDTVDYARKAATILSRSEFAKKTYYNPLQEAMNWLSGKLWSWIKDWFPKSNPVPVAENKPPLDFSGIGQLLSYVLYVAGAIALVFVVLSVIRNYRAKSPASKESRTVMDDLLAPDEPREPDAHFRLAKTAAERSDYRTAIRHLFLSLILSWDRNGTIAFQNTRTNYEWLRSAEASLDATTSIRLKFLTALFESGWYGHTMMNRSAWEDGLAHYQVLMATESSKEARA